MVLTARGMFERIGDERGVARADWSMVTVASGDHPGVGGLETLESLNERFERLGDTWYAFQNYMSIAWVYYSADDVAGASRWFVRALVGYAFAPRRDRNDHRDPARGVAGARGRPPGGCCDLLGAADHLSELYGVKAPLGLRELLGVSDPQRSGDGGARPKRYQEAFDAGAPDDARSGGRTHRPHAGRGLGTWRGRRLTAGLSSPYGWIC